FLMPTPSSTVSQRSISVWPPTGVRQFGPGWSPTRTPLPAARMRARVIMAGSSHDRRPKSPRTSPPAGRGEAAPHRLPLPLPLPLLGGRHGARGRGAHAGHECQLVDRVLGLDVELVAGRLPQHPADRCGHHPVTVGVPEDHHPAPHAGIADEVPGIDSTHTERRMIAPVIANLSCSDADHAAFSSPMLTH